MYCSFVLMYAINNWSLLNFRQITKYVCQIWPTNCFCLNFALWKKGPIEGPFNKAEFIVTVWFKQTQRTEKGQYNEDKNVI